MRHPRVFLGGLFVFGVVGAILFGSAIVLGAERLNPLTVNQMDLLMSRGNSEAAFKSARDERSASETAQVAETPTPDGRIELSPIESMFKDLDDGGYKIFPAPATEDAKKVDEAPILQYGYDIFSKGAVASQFSDSTTAVSDDYVLGPGDVVDVKVYGKVQQQFDLTIDGNGKAFIPQIGAIYLAGVRYGSLAGIIKSKLSTQYTNFDVSVSMGQVRSITVYALGDLVRPGTYTVSSLATAFQLLYLAGGPTKIGTFRNIQVIRDKRVVGTIDLYHYFLTGNRSQDIRLKNGDTLFVPIIGKVARIMGMVKRPAIYELADNDTVSDLLGVAGGVTATGYYKRVQIERIVQGEKRTAKDLTFKAADEMRSQLRAESVINGDSVRILPISQEIRNYVTIDGNVRRPGNYGYRPGMTIGDLVKSADGFLEESNLSRVMIFRFISKDNWEIISVDLTQPKSADVVLHEWDQVRVSSAYTPGTISVQGAVKKAGDQKYLKNMRLVDALSLAEVVPTADLSQIQLVRRNDSGPLQIVDIVGAPTLEEIGPSSNVFLMEGDLIMVRHDPRLTQKILVSIGGQVAFPGQYYMRSGDRISTLVEQAGGFLATAYLPGVIFSRPLIEESQQGTKEMLLESERRRWLYGNGTSVPEIGTELQSSLTDSRVLLHIQPLDTFKGTVDDLVLEDGDSMVVPRISSVVQIVGGVTRPSVLAYIPGKTAKAYIGLVGGYSEFAVRKDMYIVKANGLVSRDMAHIDPGDLIYVPEAPRVDALQNMLSVSQMIFSLAGTALAFKQLFGF